MITVGLELEWADVDRRAILPKELGEWSVTDYSLVNSDGHANCPTGETWRWGGEINTRPTETAREQGEIVHQLAMMLNPTINYKCNLHVHVRDGRFDELMASVEKLKLFAHYMRDSENFVYSTIEPIAEPTSEEFPDVDELKGAKKRYRRNLTSHHYSLPIARWYEMVNATSVQDFKDAHAPPTHSGGRAWHVAPRPGMNMRSLWKHGTVEFRHFPGSMDAEECYHAARWCQRFVKEAVNYATGSVEYLQAREIYEQDGPWTFPTFRRYDHQLQLGFERTKHK